MSTIRGKINSIQTLGTLDGPGVRFVAFLAGCPLRCACCHNPDTWSNSGATDYTAKALVEYAENFREYFGTNGGITLSGGEPLCQAEFACAVFRLCKERGINTCLDTSGIVLNPDVEKMLNYCDRVLLDIKYTNNALYKQYTGTPIKPVLNFLKFLNEKKIPTTLRQVVIPSINDNAENYEALCCIATAHSCVDTVELLPFRKICQVKYDKLSIPFKFKDIPEADTAWVKSAEQELNEKIFKK